MKSHHGIRGLAVVAVLAAGCQTFDQADLTKYSRLHGFPVTTTPSPEDSKQLGITQVQEDGFYLLGYFPIISVTLQGCLDRMVTEAIAIGAHGISDVEFEIYPAYMLKFTEFGIPDWTAMIRVSGTAYQRLPLIERRPPIANPEKVYTSPSPAPAPK